MKKVGEIKASELKAGCFVTLTGSVKHIEQVRHVQHVVENAPAGEQRVIVTQDYGRKGTVSSEKVLDLFAFN